VGMGSVLAVGAPLPGWGLFGRRVSGIRARAAPGLLDETMKCNVIVKRLLFIAATSRNFHHARSIFQLTSPTSRHPTPTATMASFKATRRIARRRAQKRQEFLNKQLSATKRFAIKERHFTRLVRLIPVPCWSLLTAIP
jgi:hypothetical protein